MGDAYKGTPLNQYSDIVETPRIAATDVKPGSRIHDVTFTDGRSLKAHLSYSSGREGENVSSVTLKYPNGAEVSIQNGSDSNGKPNSDAYTINVKGDGDFPSSKQIRADAGGILRDPRIADRGYADTTASKLAFATRVEQQSPGALPPGQIPTLAPESAVQPVPAAP
jgi:hypothetical protein